MWNTRLADLTIGDLVGFWLFLVVLWVLVMLWEATKDYIRTRPQRAPKAPKAPYEGRFPLPVQASPTAQKWFVIILAVLAVTGIGIMAAHSQNNMIDSPAFAPAPYLVPAKPTPPLKSFPILPPVEHDHYYEGDLTINMVDTLEELYAACGMQNRFLLACSTHTRTACLITVVKDEVMRSKGWTTGLLLRHEIGHCNGWGPDHAGERALTAPSPHWAPAHERPIAKNKNVIKNVWPEK
jgi:hypothetical protein